MKFCVLIFITSGLLACTQKDIRFKQYYVAGQKLYEIHCANCHQLDGTGLGRVYPPLNNSDFLDANLNKTICGIRHGMSGELLVNNTMYNMVMPGNAQLTDLEIAEISNYIYNAWGRQYGFIPIDTVKVVLRQCVPEEKQ